MIIYDHAVSRDPIINDHFHENIKKNVTTES